MCKNEISEVHTIFGFKEIEPVPLGIVVDQKEKSEFKINHRGKNTENCWKNLENILGFDVQVKYSVDNPHKVTGERLGSSGHNPAPMMILPRPAKYEIHLSTLL
jgi:hypothetical protein